MSGYPDDSRPFDARDMAVARGSAAIPSVFLILNGLFGLLLVGSLFIPFVFEPDRPFVFFREMIANQPATPEKAKAERDLDEAEQVMNQHRDEYVRRNAIFLGIGVACNLLGVVGGFYMRSLAGYRMSMAGAVASVVPFATGCCVTGIPFGIWALVVLSRPDVKAAFAANRRAATSGPVDPDAKYMQ